MPWYLSKIPVLYWYCDLHHHSRILSYFVLWQKHSGFKKCYLLSVEDCVNCALNPCNRPYKSDVNSTDNSFPDVTNGWGAPKQYLVNIYICSYIP